MSYHFFLQRIFPTQHLNLGLPHCRQSLYSLSHREALKIIVEIIEESQKSQIKEFSAFLCMGRCKILGSVKLFLWSALQLSGASILCFQASLMVRTVKNQPEMQDTWVGSLGWEDPLEKGMAAHSNILAWEIPWTEAPGDYNPWDHRVKQDWATFTHILCFYILSFLRVHLREWLQSDGCWTAVFFVSFMSFPRAHYFLWWLQVSNRWWLWHILKRPWCWERLRAGGEGEWDG